MRGVVMLISYKLPGGWGGIIYVEYLIDIYIGEPQIANVHSKFIKALFTSEHERILFRSANEKDILEVVLGFQNALTRAPCNVSVNHNDDYYIRSFV